MSEHTRILSSLGASSFTKAKNCGTCWIGSSFGDLEVRPMGRTDGDEWAFMWRFPKEIRWAFLRLAGEANVAESVIAAAGKIVKETGKARQPEGRITGGAVWTGAKAEEMIASGRPILPESWTLPASVPAPDYAWGSMAADPAKEKRAGRVREFIDAGVLRIPTGDILAGFDLGLDHLADGFVYAHRYLEYTKEAVARARAEWHPPLVPTVAMEARAAAEWSAQLRAKVEERKERETEADRVTPYWSPEEQSGDDL